MTKKRFKCVSDYDWWGVVDTTGEIKGEYDNDCFSTDTVVDLLNKLAEENSALKKEIETGKQYCGIIETDLANCADNRILLYEENLELRQIIEDGLEVSQCEIDEELRRRKK